MHSLLVVTDLDEISESLNAEVDHGAFLKIFEKRLKNPKLKVCRGVDFYYRGSKKKDEETRLCRNAVDEFYHLEKEREKEELSQQKKRIADLKKKLKVKKTKTAQTELERAERKVEKLSYSIERRDRREARDYDGRIFPLYYAPLVVVEKGKRWVRPMRFQLRPAGKDPSYDRDHGTYKARRESLTQEYFERIRYHTARGKSKKSAPSIWEPLVGKRHGLLLFKRFYETVPEGRKRVIKGFQPAEGMLLAPCLFDRWKKGQEVLDSFAVITMEAPEAIQREGYHRCPVLLHSPQGEAWLSLTGKKPKDFEEILSTTFLPTYELVA